MRWPEAAAWIAGCLLTSIFLAGEVYFTHAGREAIEAFRVRQRVELYKAPRNDAAEVAPQGTLRESRTPIAATIANVVDAPSRALQAEVPDTKLWSSSRVEQYWHASTAASIPQAILRIEALDLEVPIFYGTDESTLNQGAGVIEGTAPIGAGNTGLAAHRDGYFRRLADIALGDWLEVETVDERYRYLVTEIRVVTPDAVEVLSPSNGAALTLVTCYPFYFVGPAPERFVIRAVLRTRAALASI